MKSIGKTTLTLCLALWFIILTLPVAAMEADEAPESVTIDYLQELYEAVTFDHQSHVDMFSCSSCHHHTTGTGSTNDSCNKCHYNSPATDDVSCSGCHEKNPADTILYHIDKAGLKGALHLQCLGCHQSEDGPIGCRDCHGFTEAGRKRFSGRQ